MAAATEKIQLFIHMKREGKLMIVLGYQVGTIERGRNGKRKSNGMMMRRGSSIPAAEGVIEEV
jgi:hypothetical protein